MKHHFMIEFLKYKKVYGKELILELPDLALKDGAYWIKGENGSGKSTLLKSIAGLIPFDGSIKTFGVFSNNLEAYRKLVSYAAAIPKYPDFLKGSDLVLFYQNIRKADNEQIKFLIEYFEIKNFYSKKIGSYSSGMVKKLSLVLAFIGNPKLILLDEPFITLDKETLGKVVTLINKSIEDKMSIVFASHQEDLKTPISLLVAIMEVKNKGLIPVNRC